MMSNPVQRSPISGLQMVAALAGILIATAVLPPAAAWALNKSRVAQTEERVRTAIERLRSGGSHPAGLTSAGGVICGPGRVPDTEPSMARDGVSLQSHTAWLREARMAPELFGAGMPTDAWGRCFLLNAGGGPSDGPVWLLSAGPNGLIDTPPAAASLDGDDIGARLR